ncbi:MAG: biotin--[acetyl-CoA-carboxylase] ligase [Rhodocyclaceae bacterium]
MTVQLAPTFDLARLRAALGAALGRVDVDHLDRCGSTNTLLLERASAGAPSGQVLVADQQTAGRGRRGRGWQSSPDHSLTFSLLWRFVHGTPVAGLSLAVGVAVARALESLGVDGVALKWPNDILLFGRKLSGVLVEALFDTRGTSTVIGIGINLRQHPDWPGHVGQPYAALHDVGYVGGREDVLAAVLRELVDTLDAFAREGFISCRRDWLLRHAFQDLPVRLSSEHGDIVGQCLGVDDTGALLVETDGGILPILNGDVSLRGL